MIVTFVVCKTTPDEPLIFIIFITHMQCYITHNIKLSNENSVTRACDNILLLRDRKQTHLYDTQLKYSAI